MTHFEEQRLCIKLYFKPNPYDTLKLATLGRIHIFEWFPKFRSGVTSAEHIEHVEHFFDIHGVEHQHFVALGRCESTFLLRLREDVRKKT
jgi:hypothetical protein